MKKVILGMVLLSSVSAFADCSSQKEIFQTAEIAEFQKEFSLSGNTSICRRLKRNLENACANVSLEILAVATEVLEEDCRN